MEFKKIKKALQLKQITAIYAVICFAYIINVTFFGSFPYAPWTSRVLLAYYPEIGMPYHMLLIWFLPIWLVQMFIYITDREFINGFDNIIKTRIGVKKYFQGKTKAAFVFGFVFMYGILLLTAFVSFLISTFLLGDIDTYLEASNLTSTDGLAYLSAIHPIISLISEYFLASISIGLLAAFLSSLQFLVRDLRVTMALGMLYWYMFISSSNSIIVAMQPFNLIEYNLTYKLTTYFIFWIITTILIGIIYQIIKRKDNVK